MDDRPLECSQCKKPIEVQYTEIVGNEVSKSCMCGDCPVLDRNLHGRKIQNPCEGGKESKAGLCCGNCGTTLESVRMGNSLGCPECYEVFGDVLAHEILPKLKGLDEAQGASAMIYVGRSPGEATEISPSVRLIALNEALKETLSNEDYEQAAWLRDQIKALEKEDEQGDGS